MHVYCEEEGEVRKICCHPSAFMGAIFTFYCCFRFLFLCFHRHRETLPLSSLEKCLNFECVACLFVHMPLCVCVPFNGKTCGKFNVSDYQFSVGKLCSSMVAYCNAPFMSVKLEKFQYPSTNPTRREVEKICEKSLR